MIHFYFGFPMHSQNDLVYAPNTVKQHNMHNIRAEHISIIPSSLLFHLGIYSFISVSDHLSIQLTCMTTVCIWQRLSEDFSTRYNESQQSFTGRSVMWCPCNHCIRLVSSTFATVLYLCSENILWTHMLSISFKKCHFCGALISSSFAQQDSQT